MNKQIPSRVEAGLVEQYKNGKWMVGFNGYRGIPGDEYLAFSCTSGAVFDTEDEALAGQVRALKYLAANDKFPNMCEAF